jgi:hypothetical protein
MRGVGSNLQPWRDIRRELPLGPLLCVINDTTRGRGWSPLAPHQLRHAHAVEMAREGVPLIVIERQLGHSNLGITSVYLQGIDSGEIIETVHARRTPMIRRSMSHPGRPSTDRPGARIHRADAGWPPTTMAEGASASPDTSLREREARVWEGLSTTPSAPGPREGHGANR